jgi:hypothetical protein
MAAVKLSERHFVTARFQITGDAAPAAVDGQNLVARSMRDVKAGFSLHRAINHEPGRKRAYTREEISVY